MSGVSVAEHPVYIEAKTWLCSPQAMRVAQGYLARVGLQANPEDVTGEALVGIWMGLSKNPDRDIESVPAYCSTSMKNVVRRTVRGFTHHQGMEVEPLDRHEDWSQGLPVPDMIAPVDAALADGLREAIESHDVAADWAVAAALTYVTIAGFPKVDVSGAPAPRRGANVDQARVWPSLWFAGRHERLFPDGSGGDAAQRKRLSRAANEVFAVIAFAAAHASVGGPRG